MKKLKMKRIRNKTGFDNRPQLLQILSYLLVIVDLLSFILIIYPILDK